MQLSLRISVYSIHWFICCFFLFCRRVSRYTGSNWIPLDRCNYDAIAWGRLDPSLGSACSCMLFDTWRSVDIVGGGHESVWGTLFGCRLVCKCWHVDVAVIVVIFPTVLTLLLSGAVRPESRSQWRLYPTISASSKGKSCFNQPHQCIHYSNYFINFSLEFPHSLHSRAMECTGQCAEGGQMHHRPRVFVSDCKPRNRQSNEYGTIATSLSTAVQIPRTKYDFDPSNT